MDVKATTLTAWQSSMGQAHVDPEKGRQGDFEHWQRIFDTTNRPAGDSLVRPAAEHAETATDIGTRPPQDTRHASGGQADPRARAPLPAHGARPGQVSPGPALSDARASSPAPGMPSWSANSAQVAASTTQASASAPAQPVPQAPSGAGFATPDGRPLAQLEAHLSRGADGRLSVALRSSQPLSTAQALHAVAQALATQDGEAPPVDQVLLNGQPIYRSATPSTHRFEIDC